MRVCAGSLITTTSQDAPHFDEGCLDLDSAAMVEVTSEEKDYPVESALVLGETRGWRAADSGTQTIGLIFDQPEKLKGIALLFEETETERTQEFVLRWSSDGGRSFREIVHQQWNFSPPNTTRETEVHLSNVTVLELVIVPNNQSGSGSRFAQQPARVLTRRDPPLSRSSHFIPTRLTVAVLILDIETKWMLKE